MRLRIIKLNKQHTAKGWGNGSEIHLCWLQGLSIFYDNTQ